MGYAQNYQKIEDFVSACKDKMRDDDKGLNTIFFELQTINNAMKYQVGKDVVDGQRMSASVFVSSISRDGLEFMTHKSQLGQFDIVPTTTKEELKEFMGQMESRIQKEFIQFVEEKFETSDRKRGTCGPTVG